ncbi:MAG: hypothetical protein AAGF12_11060 [Myxococcota bacterium]
MKLSPLAPHFIRAASIFGVLAAYETVEKSEQIFPAPEVWTCVDVVHSTEVTRHQFELVAANATVPEHCDSPSVLICDGIQIPTYRSTVCGPITPGPATFSAELIDSILYLRGANLGSSDTWAERDEARRMATRTFAFILLGLCVTVSGLAGFFRPRRLRPSRLFRIAPRTAKSYRSIPSAAELVDGDQATPILSPRVTVRHGELEPASSEDRPRIEGTFSSDFRSANTFAATLIGPGLVNGLTVTHETPIDHLDRIGLGGRTFVVDAGAGVRTLLRYHVGPDNTPVFILRGRPKIFALIVPAVAGGLIVALSIVVKAIFVFASALGVAALLWAAYHLLGPRLYLIKRLRRPRGPLRVEDLNNGYQVLDIQGSVIESFGGARTPDEEALLAALRAEAVHLAASSENPDARSTR